MACEKCFSSIDAELDYHYICLACKKPTIAKPREKIHVNIYDGSGHLDVTVFGPQAINIMQSDSDMCLEVFNKDNFLSADTINKSLKDAKFFMKIRKKPRQYGGMSQFQYAVVNLLRIQPKVLDKKIECLASKTQAAIEQPTNVGTSVVEDLCQNGPTYVDQNSKNTRTRISGKEKA